MRGLRGSTRHGAGHHHTHRTTIKQLAAEGRHRVQVKYISPWHPAKVKVAKVKKAKKARKSRKKKR